MEEALRTILISDASINSRVSNRIYWNRRSQSNSTLPAIVLERITGVRTYSMSGATNLVETRVQVDCFGESYADAKLTARDVMSAINAYSGTQSGVVFQRISIDGERDNNEQESNADRYLFLTSIDLLIWHDE